MRTIDGAAMKKQLQQGNGGDDPMGMLFDLNHHGTFLSSGERFIWLILLLLLDPDPFLPV